MAEGNAQPKKSGCLKMFCIGCLTVIALFVAGGFLAVRAVKSLSNAYTDTAPTALAVAPMPEEELKPLMQRVDAFAKDARAGRETAELSLTAREINALLQRNPKTAGRIRVEIQDDRLRGDISVPVEILKNRWLNGSATFRVDTVGGRLVVFIDALSVRGKPVPEKVLNALKSKNLAENASENPQLAEVLQKLDSVAVRGDRLVIRAK